jgi:hypothetical protein
LPDGASTTFGLCGDARHTSMAPGDAPASDATTTDNSAALT